MQVYKKGNNTQKYNLMAPTQCLDKMDSGPSVSRYDGTSGPGIFTMETLDLHNNSTVKY